jgi:hypothetical protein
MIVLSVEVFVFVTGVMMRTYQLPRSVSAIVKNVKTTAMITRRH